MDATITIGVYQASADTFVEIVEVGGESPLMREIAMLKPGQAVDRTPGPGRSLVIRLLPAEAVERECPLGPAVVRE